MDKRVNNPTEGEKSDLNTSNQSIPHVDSPHDLSYHLQRFKRYSHILKNESSSDRDSLEIFRSVDSSKFLENVGNIKPSVSSSWMTVNSSLEHVDTTQQEENKSDRNQNIHSNNGNNNNNSRKTTERNETFCKLNEDSPTSSLQYYSCDALQFGEQTTAGNMNKTDTGNFEYLSKSDSSVPMNQTSRNNRQQSLQLDRSGHPEGDRRRYEIRKHSRSFLISNNHLRRTNFLKYKNSFRYNNNKSSSNNNNNRNKSNIEAVELTDKTPCTLKRTATEHISNRRKDETLINLSDNTGSSIICSPNDSIIIPDNAVIIRRKSIIRCLLPRQHSDPSKADLPPQQHQQSQHQQQQQQQSHYSDSDGKDQLFTTQNINTHDLGSRLNEYRLSENLKSSFEKEDDTKAENLLEREAHIGALALAWASGTHKSRKSLYDKHSTRRKMSESSQRKIRRYNNNSASNKSTHISADNSYTARTDLSTLKELSASIFSPPKISPLLSYTHHRHSKHRKDSQQTSMMDRPLNENDLIQSNTSVKFSHKISKTKAGSIHQQSLKTIISDTAKVAISPIICSSGENDNNDNNNKDHFNELVKNKAYYNSTDSMPERCLQHSGKHNDKRFVSLNQLEQSDHDDYEGQTMLSNESYSIREQQQTKSRESQQLQSKKSSLQSEVVCDTDDLPEDEDYEDDDDAGSTRPIGIRAKIRRNAEELRPLYGTGGPLGSVQPQMSYKSQNRGIGWRLHWRKIFNERRRKLADYSLFFAVMGILLMVLELELIMAKVYLKTSIYSMLMKSLISASTMILVGLTLVYHAVDTQLFCINNCIEDWRIAMNCRKVSLTLIEVFICLVHPPPILSNYNIYAYTSPYHPSSTIWSFRQADDILVDNPYPSISYHHSRPMTTHMYNTLSPSSPSSSSSSWDNSTYQINNLPFPTVSNPLQYHDDGLIQRDKPVPMVILEMTLSVPMFLRLYLIFRVLLLHSTMFTDAGSRSIGALNRVKINVRFVLKTLATVCPGTMLLIFILSMWIVTSWIMRVCEREQNKEYEKLLNSMWLIAVTFLSIGYGDMVPNTNCGRAISVLAGVMGSACTALVVAVVARKLELTRAEKHVHNFMQDNKFYKNLRHSAANVLRETWLFYKYTRLVKRVKPGRVRRHQRKFLTAISRLRKAKDNQRKLKEDASSMVDLAKLQTSIYDTVNYIRADQTIFVQRLLAVEKCMASIQVKSWNNFFSVCVCFVCFLCKKTDSYSHICQLCFKHNIQTHRLPVADVPQYNVPWEM
uniref:Calmodulin-binding domain-containing protein n=1 Tax=Trichobilharzia regenti TaxID=157069 RepID=A0AA85KFP1_TRIRE|nr:unnamed protein product [Trichobilharzia regenti]